MNKQWRVWLGAGALMLAAAAQADYSKHPQANAFVDTMVSKHGFQRAEVERWLSAAERQQSILDAIARPAEKAKPWSEYRKIFLTSDRIQQGVQFWREHADELARVEKELGVSPAVVVAILGVETRFGRHMGNYRVLDALATLGFDYPPRSDFFRTQLEEYFVLVREQGFAADRVKGSYAGAMGFGQFMPSSYRNFAIDFDGDGVVDIIGNPYDAIGSIANYLKQHGWKAGAPAVAPANVGAAAPDSLLTQDLRPAKTVAQFRQQGVATPLKVPDDTQAALFKLDGDLGVEYWLGFNNFYVITRYNRSQMYAMAVLQLSEAIAAQRARG